MSSRERRATADDAQQTKALGPPATRRTATVPQESRYQKAGATTKALFWNPMDVGKPHLSGQKFANPSDGGSRTDRETRHPSSLPRSTAAHSNSRLDAIAASRPPPGSATTSKTKPDVPRPSIGLYEKDRAAITLRRKTPVVEQAVAYESYVPKTRTTLQSSQPSPHGSGQGLQRDAVLSVPLPQPPKYPTTSMSPSPVYRRTQTAESPALLVPELQALAALTRLNEPQIIAAAPIMSSPSSLYSGSSDPWSSRGTTPMSMSSQSPGIIHTHKLNPSVWRPNNASQQREIKSRRGEAPWTDVPKLPAVQETAVPSSRATKKDPVTPKAKTEKSKKTKTSSPAPTPPPRKSSAKFQSPRGGEGAVDVGQEIIDAAHVAADGNAPDSPLRERNAGTVEYIGQSLAASSNLPDTRAPKPLPTQPPLARRVGAAPGAGLRALPRSHDDSSNFPNWDSLRSGSQQPPVSQHLQPPENAVFAQPEDWLRARSVPYDPGVNFPPTTTPAREELALRSDTDLGSPGLRQRAPSTSASDSEKKSTKSTPRSGFSKISTFFSRRARSDSTEAPKDNVIRPSRKGPAAGTGHEGYRKHTFRSRKMSSESSASNDSRSLMQGSTPQRPSTSRKDSGSSHRNSRNSKEDPEAEQFVAQRLDPVVIVGGGGYRHRLERDAPAPWSTADDGLALSRPGPGPRGGQAREPLSAAGSRNPALQRPTYHIDAAASPSQGTETSLTMPTMAEASLAARRSFATAQVYGNDNNHVRIPSPIQTEELAIIPAPDSYTTSQSSLPYTSSTLPQVENEMHKVDAKFLSKPKKKGRSLKWNFFSRGQSSATRTKTPVPQAHTVVKMPVTITNHPNPRSVPYYAVMDSDTDIDHPDTLGDFVADAVDSPSLDQMRASDPSHPGTSRRHGHSVLLPSFPPLPTGFDLPAQPGSPRVQLHHDEASSHGYVPSSSTARPRRLAQVGRIPRVISRKDHHHVPPAESYSRPFSRGRIDDVPAQGLSWSAAGTERPLLGIQTDVLPSRPFDNYDSAKPASAPARAIPSQDHGDVRAEQDFLTFASRHGSEASVSTDSEGIISVAAPHLVFPVHHQGEEEVWNEYDELIDRVLSPAEGRKARSLLGATLTATNRALGGRRKAQARKDGGARAVSAPTITAPVIELAPWPAGNGASGPSSEDTRLRRSRIVSALHSSFSPTSPFSLTDLVAEYEERNRISAQLPQRTSAAIKAEAAGPSSLTSLGAPDFPSLVPGHHQSTFLLDVAERDHEGPAAQSELHFAALMTSKWLSFGRVLFSPAHQEVETLPQQHVLVIDGLRSSDWSFYCALTYPSAIIHDLRESDVSPNLPSPPMPEPGRAPPNYGRVEQSSLAERFPFPTSFFTVVVLRFPPARSDAILKLMISECKRVLMPGGHLECMVMDIDMVNMGPHTRRAVKDLKVRMTQADPDVSLKLASDNVQNVLGRKGFEGLNRCIVGIPVAGKVAGSTNSLSSSSSSSPSRSNNGSYTQIAADVAGGPVAGAHAGRPRRHHQHHTNFSLSDLITDHSPTSDEKITKMIAKVGRYWYLRSFEAAVLPDGDLKQSIWADKKVLRECKSRGSGFKLWIAYAQKPVENKRRTVSEPSLPTLATAGVPAMKTTR